MSAAINEITLGSVRSELRTVFPVSVVNSDPVPSEERGDGRRSRETVSRDARANGGFLVVGRRV